MKAREEMTPAERNSPRPYNLLDREEFFRLAREVSGYLKVQGVGTDTSGRQHAMNALEAIWKGRILPS